MTHLVIIILLHSLSPHHVSRRSSRRNSSGWWKPCCPRRRRRRGAGRGQEETCGRMPSCAERTLASKKPPTGLRASSSRRLSKNRIHEVHLVTGKVKSLSVLLTFFVINLRKKTSKLSYANEKVGRANFVGWSLLMSTWHQTMCLSLMLPT